MASNSKILKAKISELEFEKWESVFKNIQKLLVNDECENEFFDIKSEYTFLLKSIGADGKKEGDIKKIRGELFTFLSKWFGSEGKGSSGSLYDASNRVIQIIKSLFFPLDPTDRLRTLNDTFLTKPLRENDIHKFDLDKLSKDDKNLIKDAKEEIKKLVLPFLSRICLDIDKPNDFKYAPIERSLDGFYLFWHTLKKVYPETNFLEGVYHIDLFVKLLRYDKSNNNSRSYDCSYQDFYRTYFGELTFKGDSFERCSFYGVDFSKSTLDKVNFKGAAFYSEEMYDDEEMTLTEEAQTGVFKNSILRELKFTGVSARNVNFSEAVFTRCILSKNAEGAVFTNMICHFTKFDQCDFSGADFSGTSFYGSDFKKLTIDSKTNFYEVNLRSCRLEFLSENEDDFEVYKSVLSKADSLYNSEMNPFLKEHLLFELDEFSIRSINKRLFYSSEELEFLKNIDEPNSAKKLILDSPVDQDLYQFKEELEECLMEALQKVKKKVSFNTIMEIKNYVKDIEKKLKNFKQQRVDQYYHKTLTITKENVESRDLENAFFNLNKIQLPVKFRKKFSSLRKRHSDINKQKGKDEYVQIVNDLEHLVQDLLEDELE